MTSPSIEWHRLDQDTVFTRLSSSSRGLDPATAAERLAAHGRNELVDRGSTHPLRLIWEQVSAVMVVILIAAALLSLVLGKFLEAGAIGAIVVLFTALGFVQEYRAERAIAALRQMSVPMVRAVRGGQLVEIESNELVPGDVAVIEAGSVVPADLRLLEVANLRVQEAALTGESEPVDKHSEAIDRDGLALGDRRCMAYAGTEVVHGRGRGLVVATGMSTELGKIASLLQDVEAEPTPLQRRLDRVGKQLAVVGVAVAAAVVAMGAAAGESASDLVLTAIGVAVAVIPEGLPAVVTFTLAIGAQRMLRRNALIRKLPAVETLGSVTIICSDKTGTLTQNVMTVTTVDVAGHRFGVDELVDDGHTIEDREERRRTLSLVLAAGALCNDGSLTIEGDGSMTTLGDPTETALLVAANRAGIDVEALRTEVPRIGEMPFDSERKRMSTLHGPLHTSIPGLASLRQDVDVVFVKGAVDQMLDIAVAVREGSSVVPLTDEWRSRLLASNDELAADGVRVLGVGYRERPSGDARDADLERDVVLVGLVGIVDPPRDEVRDAVATCRTAGIRPVMITGDHPLTARAIARDLGISDGERALTGVELDHLADAEFDAAVREIDVFARVAPEHKLRIVRALQSQGEVAAMTGDGVNDAPALKRSDIGVAMGITGTDVSKEASDMVLRDDNFATIVSAVEEGRVIYDNLRRFVSFAVAGNLGKIIVMLGWPILYFARGEGDVSTAVALLPLQLLWLNLMTDGLLGLSMGVEPAERGVMRRAPHRPGASLWANGLGIQTLWIGALIGVAALGLGLAYDLAEQAQWQTMIFTSLAFLQVFQALGTRSNIDSLRTIGWRTNPLMLVIIAVVVSLQLAALYTPLARFLDLEPLGAIDLALCVGVGAVLLATLEAVKAVGRRHARA